MFHTGSQLANVLYLPQTFFATTMNELPFEVLVLDTDDSVVRQQQLIATYGAQVVPLQDQGESLRFWCSNQQMDALLATVRRAAQTSLPKAILYGSGDYHHLAYLGISLIAEPFTVIHFDNHTDFWNFPFPRHHFLGSWVVKVQPNPWLKRVLQFGVDGDLGRYPVSSTLIHDIGMLTSGKVEMYPYRMQHSGFWGRVKAELPCARFEPDGWFRTRATWRNIEAHGGAAAFAEEMVKRIPTDNVYFTIDKDVLLEAENFAAYPDNQGNMKVQEVLTMIRIMASARKVIGFDICGDGSTLPRAKGLLRRAVLWQKDRFLPSDAYTNPANVALNERVNLQILATLVQAMRGG